MGLPKDHAEDYKRTSVTENATQIHGRLLLVHGTSDDNVHMQNSMQFMNALINNGIPFDVQIYPRKTHAISGSKTRIHLFHRIQKQFDDVLMPSLHRDISSVNVMNVFITGAGGLIGKALERATARRRPHGDGAGARNTEGETKCSGRPGKPLDPAVLAKPMRWCIWRERTSRRAGRQQAKQETLRKPCRRDEDDQRRGRGVVSSDGQAGRADFRFGDRVLRNAWRRDAHGRRALRARVPDKTSALQWEAAAQSAQGCRACAWCIRGSAWCSARHGGALGKMLPIFKLGGWAASSAMGGSGGVGSRLTMWSALSSSRC